jgi:hypothetical protein
MDKGVNFWGAKIELATFGAIFSKTHLVIMLLTRVARWFVSKPKIPNWVNFGWPYVDWKCLNILWPFGIFYGDLGYFTYDHLVHFSRFWYHVPRKIWQPCSRPPKCFPNRGDKVVKLDNKTKRRTVESKAFKAGLPDGLFSNQKS